MIVQGNLLGFDSQHIYLYSNTLQAIAVGYLIAAIIQLHFSFKWQIIITLLLLLVYWIPMTFCGDFTPQGNFAEQVDRLAVFEMEFIGMEMVHGVSHFNIIIRGFGAV